MSAIQFEVDNTLYTLEFDKETVKAMERRGFNVSKIGEEPMTQIPMLFQGAFAKHHPMLRTKRVDEIIASVGDRQGLINKLAELYVEPISELLGGNENEDDSKKSKWELVP